jgi:hypothetical protein
MKQGYLKTGGASQCVEKAELAAKKKAEFLEAHRNALYKLYRLRAIDDKLLQESYAAAGLVTTDEQAEFCFHLAQMCCLIPNYPYANALLNKFQNQITSADLRNRINAFKGVIRNIWAEPLQIPQIDLHIGRGNG